MTLEDFEKELAETKAAESSSHRDRVGKSHGDTGRHRDHHHRSSKEKHSGTHRHRHRHKDRRDEDVQDARSKEQLHKHKRSEDGTSPSRSKRRRDDSSLEKATSGTSIDGVQDGKTPSKSSLQRDAWMEAPPVSDITYSGRGQQAIAQHRSVQHLQDYDGESRPTEDDVEDQISNDQSLKESGHREVDYTFGDAGSGWRMTKLKAVFSQAHDTGFSVDEIAIQRYGDLRSFDEAREEEAELERRKTYGPGYIGKEKPTGELYLERQLRQPLGRTQESDSISEHVPELPQQQAMDEQPPPAKTIHLDQTALNRLKAQLMKAKLKNSSDYAKLEVEYTEAMASLANRKEPDVVVLGAMESRMLAGSRHERAMRLAGEAEGDGESMTIEDMIREERTTKGQAGGEGRRFAERIAKDTKFDDDLDYLDENASKLARRIQKSEISLKNNAINELQKMNRILDNCPLCHHEETDKPPTAPVISLGTRVYLTLPTTPEINIGSASIVPLQHRVNLLECDDDEWEEVRNFMKCLKRMYHDQGRDVIFYENAAAPQRRKHATMEAVPLPLGLAADAPAFFKEAILSSDEEWTQHKKIIDTFSRAHSQGLGKLAFRRSLAKEMPYFHVWFDLDGGLGHIVEDANRWPKGDLFAREVLGGMLDLDAEIVRRQGRWSGGIDGRVEGFKKTWTKFDWTSLLTEG